MRLKTWNEPGSRMKLDIDNPDYGGSESIIGKFGANEWRNFLEWG